MNYQFKTENKLKLSGERFKVHYSIYADSIQDAREKANDIALEQTVEFPEDLVPDHIKEHGILGKIESFDEVGPKKFSSTISYACEIAGGELTQFINVLFGNISIKPGIKIEKIDLHETLRSFLVGPKFGVDGIRKFWNIHNRPLLCSALKPMGLSATDLAHLASEFALGGVDLIKDDHGLANQSFSTFEKRVELCQKAIDKTNPKTIYAPNITGPYQEIRNRALFAKSVGCKALLISPMLTGFDAINMLARDPKINLPIIAHPAFIGALVTSGENGFSHYMLFGQMMRLIGADVSIYPNFGGRFSFSKEECLNIVRGCSDSFSGVKSIFPSPGGGMNFSNVPEMLKVYGNDVIYLMGGGLFRRGSDLAKSTRELKELLK